MQQKSTQKDGPTLRFAVARGDFGSLTIVSASHLGFLGVFFFAGILLFGLCGIDFGSSLDGDSTGWVGVTLRRSRTGVNGDSSSERDDSVEEDGISALVGSGSASCIGLGVGSSSAGGDPVDIACGVTMRGEVSGMSCDDAG